MGKTPFCIVCQVNKENIPDNTIKNPLLFSFPKCEIRRLNWIKVLKLEGQKIVTRAKVCECHFAEDQYGRGKTYLKRDAVPESLSFTIKKLKIQHAPLKIFRSPQIKIAPLSTIQSQHLR